jgi:hypothetical protein
MDVVDNIRTEMNNGWELFPEWIKEVFLPIKEIVIMLLDKEDTEMITLARDTVAIQNCSVDETAERQAEFIIAKQSIIDAINSIIAYRDANDPTKTPEFIEAARLARERRLSA